MDPNLHRLAKVLLVIALVAIVAAALLPALVRAPAKHGRIRTRQVFEPPYDKSNGLLQNSTFAKANHQRH